uniref:Uncharacterized protein n=1 Tax=Anopheles atroparvus TaxID=41427 RepID=A0A182INN3_ANOAO
MPASDAGSDPTQPSSAGEFRSRALIAAASFGDESMQRDGASECIKLERTQVTVHPPPDEPVPVRSPPAGSQRAAGAGRTPVQRRCPFVLDRLSVGVAGGPGELSRMRDLSLKSSPSVATSTSRQSTSCSDVALEREVTMYGCFKFNPSSR